MKKVSIQRESNFDLLKIIAILLVITSHFSVHSTNEIFLKDPYKFNINYILTLILTTGCIANNIFILITGYFMVNKEKNNKKIISLILDMEIYSISIYLLLNIIGLIKNISPFKSIFVIFYGNWFCIYYIFLYLISPYLNQLIKALTKEQLKKLIITLLVIISIIPTFTDTWEFDKLEIFIVSYLIGAYIKLYQKKSLDTKKIKMTLLYTIILVIICIISLYTIGINLKLFPFIKYYPQRLLSNNNSIFVIIIATCMFLIAKNKKIKYNKHINKISTASLGIYLIHDNYLLKDIIWNKIVPSDLYFTKLYFPLFAIIKITTVFIICYILVLIKELLLDKQKEQIINKIIKK